MTKQTKETIETKETRKVKAFNNVPNSIDPINLKDQINYIDAPKQNCKVYSVALTPRLLK